MNNITYSFSYKHFFYVFALCIFTGSTHGMKRLIEEPSASARSLSEEKPPRTEKLKNIWIKTSDDKLLTMPEWQVDQVKVLQMLLVNQKGNNRRNNPINLSHLQKNNGAIVDTSKNALNLIKTALEISKNPKDVSTLHFLMTPENYRILINTAADLEAHTLFAGLASTILPQEMQSRIGGRILVPIIDYFIKSLANKIISPEEPNNAQPIPHAPSIKISSNGKYILSSDRYEERNSILWDVSTQKTVAHTNNSFNDMNFSSNSTYVISRAMDNYLIYDYISETKEFVINNSNCITFSADDIYCLYNSTATPGIINVKSHTNKTWIDLPPLQGHNAHVNTIQCSPDGNYIISGSDDDYPNNLILWNGKSFEKITTLMYEGPWSPHIYPVIRAYFSPDSKYVISQDNKDNIIVWDVVSKKPISKLDVHNKARWEINNEKPHMFKKLPSTFMHGPGLLHTYVNHNADNKILYELSFNKIFDHAILPVNNNALNVLKTEPRYRKIICSQYSSIPPFQWQKDITAITNDNNYQLKHAVESSDSQYLALSYLPEYITLIFTDTTRLLHIPSYTYKFITFSPKNDYIIISHVPTAPKNQMFSIWKIADLKMMQNICYDKNINLAQSRLLYRLYIAHMNRVKVIINQNDSDYEVYKSLSADLKNLVDRFLPFKIIQNASEKFQT